jgi:crotonobetainyl-CoA:carnitine CoA-transferase CaiB-like acyl-CoA transferase
MKDGHVRPFEETRILDLADEKGSFCSKLFADLGADVIKVERPGGDPSRKIGPFLEDAPHPEQSLFFFYHNTNKKGITLNLEHPAAKEIFYKLLKGVDVLIETFPPGYFAGLGLGDLSETHPQLIRVSITGFGLNGPVHQHKSCDLVAAATGGQMYVSGSPSFPPLKVFGEQSFYAASLHGAVAIMLALRKRAQSGRGEQIQISLQESVASTSGDVIVRYSDEKSVPQRQGSLYGNSFCTLPCRDGYLLLSISQQWETLVEWMDGEGMAGDLTHEKWNNEEYRRKNLTLVIETLQRWTKTHSVEELFELGQSMRLPWAPVLTPSQALENSQLKSRHFFVRVGHPEINSSMEYPGLPYGFGSQSLERWKRAPRIGEDNVRVYGDELGFSEQEVEELRAKGVI